MTGAPVVQLCQIAALSASNRCTMRAHSPAGRAAVAFEAELVFQRPDDRLNPLPQPVRELAGLFLVLAGRADQDQAEVRAGEGLPGVRTGQALVGDDGGAGRWAVRRLVFPHLPGGLLLTEQLGVGQAEPGHGPVAGANQQQLGAPIPAGMAGAIPVPRPASKVRALRGEDRLAAWHRGGIHQPHHLGGLWGGIGGYFSPSSPVIHMAVWPARPRKARM